MLRFRPDGDGAGEGAPAPDPTPTPAAESAPAAPAFDPSAFASKEDVDRLGQSLNYLVQMFQEPQDPQQDPQQDDEIDIDAYVQSLIHREFAPVRPLLDATVKERGEKEMQRIFGEVKTELKTDFDEKLAERVAQSFLAEHGGDPVEATKAGARYAAEVRKAEREAGGKAYQERLQRGPGDYELGVEGGGTAPRPKFKSYDDVTAYYAGETEA
jgi:hypothetical protein